MLYKNMSPAHPKYWVEADHGWAVYSVLSKLKGLGKQWVVLLSEPRWLSPC
jgi:hypothetical protein